MIACIVLAASMVGMYLNLTAIIQQQTNTINKQTEEIQKYKDAIDELLDATRNLYRQLETPIDDLAAQLSYFQLHY